MHGRLTGAETRARILAATAALIEERGVAGASVTLVMERAGVSRTAFYRHFTDPYEVMGVLLQRIGAEVLGRSGDWLNDPRSVGSPDVVYPNLLSYARAYVPYARLLAAMADAAAVDGRVHALWRDGIVQAYIDTTADAIERDQAAGAIRPDLDAQATAYALSLLGERASYDFLGRQRRGGPEDYARMLSPIWIGTLFGTLPADGSNREGTRDGPGVEAVRKPENPLRG